MYLHFIRANKSKHGGAEVYLSRLSDELERQEIVHDVVYSPYPKWIPSWLRVLFFNRFVCRRKRHDDLYFSLERIICPDIYRAGDGVHKVFLETKKRKINPLNLVYLWLERRCFEKSRKIIANSRMIKRQIIDTYNIAPEKIAVVYNGIPFKPMAAYGDIQREFSLGDEPVILFVGSGFERKGVKEAIKICSRLKHPYSLLVVGKEKRMAHYEALARQCNVNVRFVGPRTDVEKFYSLSDIFLFPTHYEPFSNVVLEAMNFHNAVFTTKQNGASEILDERFVMESPEDYAVAEQIDALLENRGLLEKVKCENFQKVQSFSIEKNAKETLKVIEEVLEI